MRERIAPCPPDDVWLRSQSLDLVLFFLFDFCILSFFVFGVEGGALFKEDFWGVGLKREPFKRGFCAFPSGGLSDMELKTSQPATNSLEA